MTLIESTGEAPIVRLAPVADPARLEELGNTGLLDGPPEASFDRLTRLAARFVGAPVSLVSLVDQDRQFFKSAVGLEVRETPLSHSFCQYVVATGEPLIIDDARTTPLVAENLAIRDLGVIAYAGIPLVTARGHVLGSFCVIDSEPRHWTAEEIGTLRDLAALVTTEIEYRLKVREADELAGIGLRLEAPLRDLGEHIRTLLRLLGDTDDPRLEQFAMLADGRIRGISTIVGQLRAAAAGQPKVDASFAATDLSQPVGRAVAAARVVARTSGIRLVMGDEPLRASCNSWTLEQSVTHLLISALHHSEGLADISVALTREADVGELLVSTPAVIPTGDLATILGRFHYATCDDPVARQDPRLSFKTVRGGLEAENGPLRARSAQGEGTTFTLRVSLMPGTAHPAA